MHQFTTPTVVRSRPVKSGRPRLSLDVQKKKLLSPNEVKVFDWNLNEISVVERKVPGARHIGGTFCTKYDNRSDTRRTYTNTFIRNLKKKTIRKNR